VACRVAARIPGVLVTAAENAEQDRPPVCMKRCHLTRGGAERGAIRAAQRHRGDRFMAYVCTAPVHSALAPWTAWHYGHAASWRTAVRDRLIYIDHAGRLSAPGDIDMDVL